MALQKGTQFIHARKHHAYVWMHDCMHTYIHTHRECQRKFLKYEWAWELEEHKVMYAAWGCNVDAFTYNKCN